MKYRRLASDRILTLNDFRWLVIEGDFEGLIRELDSIDKKPFEIHPEGGVILDRLARLRVEVEATANAPRLGIDWRAIGLGYHGDHMLSAEEQQLMASAVGLWDLQLTYFARFGPLHASKLQANFQQEKNRKAEESKRRNPVKRQAEDLWQRWYEERRRKHPNRSTKNLLEYVEQQSAAYECNPDLKKELTRSWKAIGRRIGVTAKT